MVQLMLITKAQTFMLVNIGVIAILFAGTSCGSARRWQKSLTRADHLKVQASPPHAGTCQPQERSRRRRPLWRIAWQRLHQDFVAVQHDDYPSFLRAISRDNLVMEPVAHDFYLFYPCSCGKPHWICLGGHTLATANYDAPLISASDDQP
eukprot:gnl/TRDRNA2_/TRDRNA2_158335_c1_seq1.p1 gnl/TRDRNA2_/TRDRNA2_158335_c1~~gnl/TRDRNA2_/TRDRNA2_158335_c1_seq1.p1  ORF type:complete len:150 (+),score=4.74 gnl/TRDRNA2_/TRDRNA2_158335_c1_seq1:230-679(+)